VSLRVVALDMSLTGLGLAHSHDHHGRPRLGCRTVHSGRRGQERIHDIRIDVAAAMKSKPDLVVVEGPSYASQGSAVYQLGELRGVILHYIWALRVPVAEMAPATLKVYATGRGTTRGENKVTKREVREKVTATYGHLLHIGSDDEADATTLLAAALHAYGQPLAPVPETHRRALDAVRWPQLPVRPEVAAAVAGVGKAGA
jgi:crossover junction endodeoxyribonuclease RuvC